MTITRELERAVAATVVGTTPSYVLPVVCQAQKLDWLNDNHGKVTLEAIPGNLVVIGRCAGAEEYGTTIEEVLCRLVVALAKEQP